MSCDYYIWDTVEEEFIGTQFASYQGAEAHIQYCLADDFERYLIFERLS